ncbi:MAG TPA: phosphoserine transaminase [Alphaproteobacteria bacterium]|nr:phosphoserine transaminase [Alphaproteobacteria bacterium]
MKPTSRPANPDFSSGPCAKFPGWTVQALNDACVGRSHRSKDGKAKLAQVIDQSRKILGIPADYRIGIVPASDTGAVEMALWSLLGPLPVDVLAWESFGAGWVGDITKELKLKDVKSLKADYGKIADLSATSPDHDIVFTWNGTTSGVRVPNGDWIKSDRKGLTICDATSAVFAMDLPWDKLDVVTWSWQKVLGGEAAHGMIVLSPRAVERILSYTPPWPMPKIFRMKAGDKLAEGIFKGDTINTPSMIAVEDQIAALNWSEKVGGLKGLIGRSEGNLAAIAKWVDRTPWVGFLAEDAAIRSCTSVCLKITAPWVAALDAEKQAAVPKRIVALLEKEGVAFDIDGYRDAPPGMRIWAGATVETSDLEALFPWLDWAFEQAKAEFAPAA